MGGFETMTDKLLEVALCGYLPYGVQVVGDRKIYYTVDGIRTIKTGDISIKSNDTHIGFIRELNLALRPISCLTKPITVPNYNQGKEFVPIVELLRLQETNSFHTDEHIRLNFDESKIISCVHMEYRYTDKRDFIVKYVSTDHHVYSFTYDPETRRFATRDETLSKPLGIAFQADMFDLMNQWLIDWRDLIGKGLAVSID